MLFKFVFGYGLFEACGIDEIGQRKEVVQRSIVDLIQFGKLVKFTVIQPFSSKIDALNHCNALFKRLIGKKN